MRFVVEAHTKLSLAERREALLLAPLVAKDYERRRNGLRADRWHWADVRLMKMGVFLHEEGLLL